MKAAMRREREKKIHQQNNICHHNTTTTATTQLNTFPAELKKICIQLQYVKLKIYRLSSVYLHQHEFQNSISLDSAS